jgi:hypothetical protein
MTQRTDGRYVRATVVEPTSPEYPTRCPDCGRAVERYSVFPGGRCIDDHAARTAPVTDARELARMWGAQ